MNSIVWTYPGFELLPDGIKQMLLVSEAHFSNGVKHAAAHAVLGRVESARYWTPQMFRTTDGQLRGTCGAWGKQNQFIPTLTV